MWRNHLLYLLFSLQCDICICSSSPYPYLLQIGQEEVVYPQIYRDDPNCVSSSLNKEISIGLQAKYPALLDLSSLHKSASVSLKSRDEVCSWDCLTVPSSF